VFGIPCNKVETFHHKGRWLVQSLITLYTLVLQVRKKAQSVLFSHFNTYPYSYRCLVDQVVGKLKDKETPEHQFQVKQYCGYMW